MKQNHKKNRIVIFVEGGVVSGACATDPEIELEIIDRDTDDADRCMEIQAEAEEIEKDVESGELYAIY